jgi:peptidoglycan hydrolase CwlO-like protein
MKVINEELKRAKIQVKSKDNKIGKLMKTVQDLTAACGMLQEKLSDIDA